MFRANDRVLQRRFQTTSSIGTVFKFLCSEGYHHEEEINVWGHDKTNLISDGEILLDKGIAKNECFYITKAVKRDEI